MSKPHWLQWDFSWRKRTAVFCGHRRKAESIRPTFGEEEVPLIVWMIRAVIMLKLGDVGNNQERHFWNSAPLPWNVTCSLLIYGRVQFQFGTSSVTSETGMLVQNTDFCSKGSHSHYWDFLLLEIYQRLSSWLKTSRDWLVFQSPYKGYKSWPLARQAPSFEEESANHCSTCGMSTWWY